MRFNICDLEDGVRLAGSSHSFILQERENGKWKDRYYWHSIRDVVSGYINYMAKRMKISIDKTGISALLELLNRLEEKNERFIGKFDNIYQSDPVEDTEFRNAKGSE